MPKTCCLDDLQVCFFFCVISSQPLLLSDEMIEKGGEGNSFKCVNKDHLIKEKLNAEFQKKKKKKIVFFWKILYFLLLMFVCFVCYGR